MRPERSPDSMQKYLFLAALFALLQIRSRPLYAENASNVQPSQQLGLPLDPKSAAPTQKPSGAILSQPESIPPPPIAIPSVVSAAEAPVIPKAEPESAEKSLPINLATALQLVDGRPLIVEAARAGETIAYSRLEQANVLWLPDVLLGSDYQRHDGAAQRTTGEVAINSRNQLMAGGGLKAVFGLTDAIYAPLAAQQVYRARTYDVQAAQNDALLGVTDAYFQVQESRGVLAGYLDTTSKGRELVKKVRGLGLGLTAPIEVDRAEAAFAELEQQTIIARGEWRMDSANLTRILRLDPAAVVVPTEPPHLKVTIVSPDEGLDQLIPDGLLTRPELASQRAELLAAGDRVQQERMRPWIPNLVMQGSSNPGSTLGGTIYGANLVGNDPTWAGRSDWDFQVLWQLDNLGAGNVAAIHERNGEQQSAAIELARIRDFVASDIVKSHAQVLAADARVKQAEIGLAAARTSFDGNLKGLGETIRSGDQLQLTIRPQEATAALRQLLQAYINYYSSVNDYNRAQFRLYHAIGYPAQRIVSDKAWGEPQPMDGLENSSCWPGARPRHHEFRCYRCSTNFAA